MSILSNTVKFNNTNPVLREIVANTIFTQEEKINEDYLTFCVVALTSEMDKLKRVTDFAKLKDIQSNELVKDRLYYAGKVDEAVEAVRSLSNTDNEVSADDAKTNREADMLFLKTLLGPITSCIFSTNNYTQEFVASVMLRKTFPNHHKYNYAFLSSIATVHSIEDNTQNGGAMTYRFLLTV